MKFGSVCSGIEAASVAWEPIGWNAAWFSEIEPFPSAVLAHHYPSVANLGDMTAIARRVLTGEVEAPDVLCGGTPCQAFSVAGLRESLADERGNLTLKFVELADAIDHIRGRAGLPPAVVFWENVPGVFSTKDNAFGCFLAGLAGEDDQLQPPGKKWENAGAVYGPARAIAWRTLDAQHFGVAQRRRRVFVVASARPDFDPAAVLFEWDGVRRDSAPGREAAKDTSGSTGDGIARCLTTGEMKRQDWETCNMVASDSLQVRRLTPVECERLQGFPDNYTAIPWRKKPASDCPDGPRYKALGNSWAVPVVRWIGRRIDAAICSAERRAA